MATIAVSPSIFSNIAGTKKEISFFWKLYRIILVSDSVLYLKESQKVRLEEIYSVT